MGVPKGASIRLFSVKTHRKINLRVCKFLPSVRVLGTMGN